MSLNNAQRVFDFQIEHNVETVPMITQSKELRAGMYVIVI